MSPTHTLTGVQYLRAIAALMVAYYHVTIQIPAYTGLFQHQLMGTTRLANGVDMFFVISGFIMFVTSRRGTPGDFMMRRIIRIVPLYWLLTLLLVLLHTLKPDMFHTTIVRTDFVLKSLLFIPYSPTGDIGNMEPVLVAGWTLNFEMFFYVLFALTLFAPVRNRVALLAAAFASMLFAARGLHLFSGLPALQFLASLRLFEFWGGMLLAEAYLAGFLRIPSLLSLSMIITFFILMLHGIPMLGSINDSARFVLETILPATAIVASVVSLDAAHRIPRWPMLAYIGDASYSIYLSHPFSFGVARVVWTRLVHGAPTLGSAAAFGVFAMLLCLLGGIVTYRYLEQPMLKSLTRWYKAFRPSASGAAVASGSSSG